MIYQCCFCDKCVTSDLPNESVIRAVLVCPECIEAGKISFPEKTEEKDINANDE